jgi:nucleotide-binding universal stress UspA family protein
VQRIVVGVDGSKGSQRALEWAMDEATLRGASVTLVHAWSIVYQGGFPHAGTAIDPTVFERDAKQVIDAAVRSITPSTVKLDTALVCGGGAEALLAAAKGADLVVVGTRGLGGFSELLLGSVSHQVAHHASCPVVIIPASSY